MDDPAISGRPDGLLDGEELLALVSVRFSAGVPAHIDAPTSPSMYRAAVVQRHAYADWAKRATAIGFPVAGPEMILGATPERLLVWRPALVRSRPRLFAGAVPLSRIRRAGVHRRVFASILTLLFDEGTIVGVETMRGSRLRAFAVAIPTYTDYRAR
ncbi:MAG: hypothetical protein QOH10_1682 [Actinomycetota bacterium]|nr:hypothetical protein [Actinomycetota bacterium]